MLAPIFIYLTLIIPLQVKTDMDFEIVKREDCAVVGDREEMFSKLEKDLIEQVCRIMHFVWTSSRCYVTL